MLITQTHLGRAGKAPASLEFKGRQHPCSAQQRLTFLCLQLQHVAGHGCKALLSLPRSSWDSSAHIW